VDAPVQTSFIQDLYAGRPNQMLPADREDFRRVLKLVMEDPPYIPGFAIDVLADRALKSPRIQPQGVCRATATATGLGAVVCRKSRHRHCCCGAIRTG
jgi:hypothetical protein